MKKNNVIEAKSNMTWKQWSIEIEIQYKVQALHFKNCIRKKSNTPYPDIPWPGLLKLGKLLGVAAAQISH
jgi:uncharacterized membrane protein